MTVAAYRGLPAPTGMAAGRKTPRPGSQRRPGTPTPLLPIRAAEGGAVVNGVIMKGLTATLNPSEQSQSRGDVLRERYQALEEFQRGKSLQRSLSRPVMLSSVRSFSYELPTQIAEMERMSSQRSSSPAVPQPNQTPHLTPRRSAPSRSTTPLAGEDTGGGNP